jgi:hypothetical protein
MERGPIREEGDERNRKAIRKMNAELEKDKRFWLRFGKERDHKEKLTKYEKVKRPIKAGKLEKLALETEEEFQERLKTGKWNEKIQKVLKYQKKKDEKEYQRFKKGIKDRGWYYKEFKKNHGIAPSEEELRKYMKDRKASIQRWAPKEPKMIAGAKVAAGVAGGAVAIGGTASIFKHLADMPENQKWEDKRDLPNVDHESHHHDDDDEQGLETRGLFDSKKASASKLEGGFVTWEDAPYLQRPPAGAQAKKKKIKIPEKDWHYEDNIKYVRAKRRKKANKEKEERIWESIKVTKQMAAIGLAFGLPILAVTQHAKHNDKRDLPNVEKEHLFSSRKWERYRGNKKPAFFPEIGKMLKRKKNQKTVALAAGAMVSFASVGTAGVIDASLFDDPPEKRDLLDVDPDRQHHDGGDAEARERWVEAMMTAEAQRKAQRRKEAGAARRRADKERKKLDKAVKKAQRIQKIKDKAKVAVPAIGLGSVTTFGAYTLWNHNNDKRNLPSVDPDRQNYDDGDEQGLQKRLFGSKRESPQHSEGHDDSAMPESPAEAQKKAQRKKKVRFETAEPRKKAQRKKKVKAGVKVAGGAMALGTIAGGVYALTHHHHGRDYDHDHDHGKVDLPNMDPNSYHHNDGDEQGLEKRALFGSKKASAPDAHDDGLFEGRFDKRKELDMAKWFEITKHQQKELRKIPKFGTYDKWAFCWGYGHAVGVAGAIGALAYGMSKLDTDKRDLLNMDHTSHHHDDGDEQDAYDDGLLEGPFDKRELVQRYDDHNLMPNILPELRKRAPKRKMIPVEEKWAERSKYKKGNPAHNRALIQGTPENLKAFQEWKADIAKEKKEGWPPKGRKETPAQAKWTEKYNKGVLHPLRPPLVIDKYFKDEEEMLEDFAREEVWRNSTIISNYDRERKGRKAAEQVGMLFAIAGGSSLVSYGITHHREDAKRDLPNVDHDSHHHDDDEQGLEKRFLPIWAATAPATPPTVADHAPEITAGATAAEEALDESDLPHGDLDRHAHDEDPPDVDHDHADAEEVRH